MLGLQMIYLEGRKRCNKSCSVNIIKAVRQNISIPLAVGGGIKNKNEIEDIFNAGADLIFWVMAVRKILSC